MRARLIGALLVLLLLPGIVAAQETKTAHYFAKYDLASGSYITCVTTGQNGDPWAEARPGTGTGGNNIKTSGSSTTVTEVTSSSLPFALLAVGDQIFVNGTTRWITAKASGASITVNATINIENGGSGYPFTWKQVTCGTAATNGWIDVSQWIYKKLSVHINTLASTSVDVKWECLDNTYDANPVNVYPGGLTAGVCPGGTVASNACNYTAGGQNARTDVEIDAPYSACRPMLKVNGDSAGDVITAYIKVWGAR